MPRVHPFGGQMRREKCCATPRTKEGIHTRFAKTDSHGNAEEENLQNRLDGQEQTEDPAPKDTEHPIQQNHRTSISSVSNENGRSEDRGSQAGNEAEELEALSFIPTTMSPDFDGEQCWSASTLGPLGSFEHVNQALFPPFSPRQILSSPPVRQGLEGRLTSIICTDLDQLFFDRVYTFAPMVQKFRYLSSSKSPDKPQQRKCLQYAMWTLAASVSSQFQLIRADLYAEAQQLLETLETENQGHPYLEQVQAWILLSIYELSSKMTNYQRGMVSAGRAFRLIQMMRLNEMDGPDRAVISANWSGHGKGHCDWIDHESVRRTFWVAYTIDRFTSPIDGLALTFNERQIFTRLPASDTNFHNGRATNTCFLSELVDGSDPDRLGSMGSSPFIQSIVVASICGRTLEHKQRPHAHRQTPGQDAATDGDFIRQHHALKGLLTRHIKILSTNIMSTLQHPEPMLIFGALATQMAVLMLSETVESRPMGADMQATEAIDSLQRDHQQWSLEAVHRLSMLAATIGQINHFQTHPFTPIPFLVSSRFCLRHLGQNEAYRNFVLEMATALEGLSSVNGLAQSCLRLLSCESAGAWDAGGKQG